MPQLFVERNGRAHLLSNGHSRPVDQFEAERALRDEGPPKPVYMVGLDLGTVDDYTALSVVEVTDRHNPGHAEYLVSHLERWRQVSYPRIAEEVLAILARPPLAAGAELLVDATGVGLPIVQLLQRMGLKPVGITITSGDQVGHNAAGLTVPKQSLVGCMQVVVQQRRIRVSPQLPSGRVLAEEMADFQRRQNAVTGYTQYANWREGAHDDLVLSVAMALWRGESTSVVRFY